MHTRVHARTHGTQAQHATIAHAYAHMLPYANMYMHECIGSLSVDLNPKLTLVCVRARARACVCVWGGAAAHACVRGCTEE